MRYPLSNIYYNDYEICPGLLVYFFIIYANISSLAVSTRLAVYKLLQLDKHAPTFLPTLLTLVNVRLDSPKLDISMGDLLSLTRMLRN